VEAKKGGESPAVLAVLTNTSDRGHSRTKKEDAAIRTLRGIVIKAVLNGNGCLQSCLRLHIAV